MDYDGPERRTRFRFTEAERAALAQAIVEILASDKGETFRLAIAASFREHFLHALYEDTGKTAWRILRLLAWTAAAGVAAWFGFHWKPPE